MFSLFYFTFVLMICFPNAKINLGLYITKKRPDGYHEIETCLYPIPLTDALEIRTSKNTTSFENLGIQIADIAPEQTSVMRAYQLLKEDFKLPAIDIVLYKNIPFGAGLGGGSADAAFMLKLLNSYFALNISVKDLEKYAAKLGSDDAFFIKNTPQLATGRGEILQNIKLSLKGLYLVLLQPDIHISTPMAYQNIVPEPANFKLEKLNELPIAEWNKLIFNHFEKGLFSRLPVLQELKEELYEVGASYASLSGSGSALYGLFVKKPSLSPILQKQLLWQGVL